VADATPVAGMMRPTGYLPVTMTALTKDLYTATATATGGRDGRAVTNDGKLDVALAAPKELGGSGEGTNPEQLFAPA
jgi:osmotically inducible protein OsmC